MKFQHIYWLQTSSRHCGWSPNVKLLTCLPLSPEGPTSPEGPGGPLWPFTPSAPSRPLVPFAPGSPFCPSTTVVSPVVPLSPLSPWAPNKNTSTWSSFWWWVTRWMGCHRLVIGKRTSYKKRKAIKTSENRAQQSQMQKHPLKVNPHPPKHLPLAVENYSANLVLLYWMA